MTVYKKAGAGEAPAINRRSDFMKKIDNTYTNPCWDSQLQDRMDADFYDDEARAGTRASDRQSDRMMGWNRNPYGKYPTVQVETVDDLGWGSTPIASLFAEEKSDGFWRLQTEDAHLKKQMKPRAWNARSPWQCCK